MQYLVTFLEGIITFISPCLLPLLPVYITFFAGDPEKNGGDGNTGKGSAVIRALGFILGFTVIFVILGVAFAAVGRFLNRWKTVVNIFAGAIVIFFALTYLGVIKWNPILKVK